MKKLITHKQHNGSGNVYLLNGQTKHWIENWESFELGQKLGLWGTPDDIQDVPEDKEIKNGISFCIKQSYKFKSNPLDKLVCTQKFGGWPEFYKKWGMKGHNGIDFRTKLNDSPDGIRPVYSVLDGTISVAETVEGKSGYGKYVKIIHEGGEETVYAHLSSIDVLKGQKVEAGEKLGMTGNTGAGTAAHLHFGFRPKKMNINNGYKGSIDPINYFVGDIKFV